MTWAQAAFHLIAFLFLPAFSFCAYLNLRRAGAQASVGTAKVFGTLLVALLGVVAFLFLIFPDYPRTFVAEPLALATTLPVLLTALYIARSLEFTDRGLAIVALAFSLCVAGSYNLCWTPRRLLPFSAAIVSESAYMPSPIFPDHEYRLSARMGESEFIDYVTRLGLTKVSGETRHADFDELVPTEVLYANETRSHATFATLYNGVVYIYSFQI